MNVTALIPPNFRGRQKAVLRLYRKFHRELVDDLLGISINDEAYSIFGADAALVAIENLVLIHFRGGSLMLHSATYRYPPECKGTCERRTCRPAADCRIARSCGH